MSVLANASRWIQTLRPSFGVTVLGLGISGALPALATCPANLEAALAPIINSPDYASGRWGIVVQTLPEPNSTQVPQTLYALDVEKHFLVASNVKLFTTAAALQQFGPDFRLRTEVFGVGTGGNWNWVRLVGRGDPTLTTADLDTIAQGLWQQGIRQIQTLEITSLPFPEPPLNPTWALEDTNAGYIAPITRLALNRNALPLVVTPQALNQPLKLAWENPHLGQGWRLENQTQTIPTSQTESLETQLDEATKTITVMGQLHVGSDPATLDIPLSDPFSMILDQWRAALENVGIQVKQVQFQHSDRRPMGQPLFTHPSPTLAELVQETNQVSDNFYAETLNQLLATIQPGKMAEILAAWNLTAQDYQLSDGSGLSRQNWVTPTGLVKLLQAQRSSTHWPTFKASLPQAGMTGTLRRRFLNTPAQGRVWAKTGTLRGVSALSGYAYPADFPPLAFSIVINQANQDATQLRPGIDQVVLELMKLQPCAN